MSGLETLLRARQSDAAQTALALGLPNKQTEAWKYVPTRVLARTAWVEAAQRRSCTGFGLSQGHFVNIPQIDGLTISQGTLTDAETDRLDALRQRHGFQAAAIALSESPWIISVVPNAQVELSLTHFANLSLSAAFGLCVIRIGANAELKLTERFEASEETEKTLAGWTALITLDRDARMHLGRLQTAGAAAHVFETLQVEVGENARFQHFVSDFGAQLSRLDLTIDLVGAHAHAQCNGLLVTGGQQYHDVHLDVNHRVGQTSSAMTYRTMVDAQGEATLNGRVYIAKDAQRAATEQSLANLLVSDRARVNPKPELEIYADDVTASHGCTVGSLNATELFYLRSRGLSASDARAVLQYAFAERVIETLEDETLRADIEHRLLGTLKQGELIRELQDAAHV
ncbi:MAG: hypothetical protein EBS77_02250 [Gammaproteobacteria bacterium]|nr:hypothetical protein [Gammaproteobacteria bacterium]